MAGRGWTWSQAGKPDIMPPPNLGQSEKGNHPNFASALSVFDIKIEVFEE